MQHSLPHPKKYITVKAEAADYFAKRLFKTLNVIKLTWHKNWQCLGLGEL